MAYRISFFKTAGWIRLGLTAAAGVLFATPMLWAVGSFGAGDEALHRAVIFALSGLWTFIAVGYLAGWALQGFVLRQKAHDEETSDDGPGAGHGAPPSRGGAPGKPGGH